MNYVEVVENKNTPIIPRTRILKVTVTEEYIKLEGSNFLQKRILHLLDLSLVAVQHRDLGSGTYP